MSKINVLILLLIGFILYKGFNFNKKISPARSAKISVQKKIKFTKSPPVVTNTAETIFAAQDPQRANFDSLNDLNENQHIEGIPAENAAVPVEKLTPAEMEQYQISLYEQKIVSETGTVQIAPQEIKEGEP